MMAAVVPVGCGYRSQDEEVGAAGASLAGPIPQTPGQGQPLQGRREGGSAGSCNSCTGSWLAE